MAFISQKFLRKISERNKLSKTIVLENKDGYKS